jgi:hypothetical protein
VQQAIASTKVRRNKLGLHGKSSEHF